MRHTTDPGNPHTRPMVARRYHYPTFAFNILQFPSRRAELILLRWPWLDHDQLAHAIRALGWGMRAWLCGRCVPLPHAALSCLSGESSTCSAALAIQGATDLSHHGHRGMRD